MKLSIIIAAYNVEKYIKKCINSCAIQDVNNTIYEIIVVNDGSTDNTLRIIESLKPNINNLKIVNQENSGLGACRNTGLKNSIGNFLWFIDGDDYLKKNMLQTIFNKINNNKLETLALNYSVVDESYNIITQSANKLTNINSIITGSYFYKYNYSNSYTWSFIFKKELFFKNNVRFKEKINMQDSEILPKLLINCNRISFLDEKCYYYVQQVNSYTNSVNGEKRYNYFKSIIEVRNSLQDFLKLKTKNNPEITIGLNKKIVSLHSIIFHHLVFFQYEQKWLKKIIVLLKDNDYYPIQYKAKGKMKLIKIALNINSVLANKIIHYIKK